MPPAVQTDRGWAWVVLAATMGCMFLNGILLYFVGVVHSGLLRKFHDSVSLTAWVGSVYSSLLSLGVPVASLVMERLGCRACGLIGGILCFVGLSSSALVTSVGQLFFTYGIIAGMGLGLTYGPSIATIGYHFDRLRGLASGVSAAAAGVGILSGSLIMQTLIDEYSVDGAFLIAGAVAFHHCLAAMFYRPTVYERRGSQALEDRTTTLIIGSTLSLQRIQSSTRSLPLLGGKTGGSDLCVNERRVALLGGADCEARFSSGENLHNAIQERGVKKLNCSTGNLERTSSDKEHMQGNHAFHKSTDTVSAHSGEHPNCVDRQSDLKARAANHVPSSGHDVESAKGRHCGKVCGDFWRVIRCTAFMCYSSALLLVHFSMMGVYLHLPEYTRSLGTSPTEAASLFLPIGVMSLVSRLVSGMMTTDSRIDPLTITMGLTGLCGLATALFPLYAGTYVGQLTFSALFGLYTGGLVALFSVVIVQFMGIALLNTGLGVLGAFCGIGTLLGPVFAALIVDMGGTYEHSFIFLGCMLELAFFLTLAAGFFLKSHGEAAVDETVIGRDFMGSTLILPRLPPAEPSSPAN